MNPYIFLYLIGFVFLLWAIADPVMIPQSQTLIAQYGSFGLMVEMIANKLYLFAGFGTHGVIHNKGLFRISDTIAEGYYPQDRKIYELSTVEPFMIQKSILSGCIL